MIRNNNFMILYTIAFIWLVQGCGLWVGNPTKPKPTSGTNSIIKLAMVNGTGAALVDTDCPDLGGGFHGDECFTPTHYGIKMLSVYMTKELESMQDPVGLVWANSNCQTATSATTIDDKSYEYDSVSDGCTDDKVSDFFELARSSTAVNTDLGSQERKVLPGAYKYVKIDFCIGGAASKNVEFQTSDMVEPFQIKSGMCGVTSLEADPPVTIGEGETGTVTLTYDLSDVIYYAQGSVDDSICYVSPDASITRCFGYPQLLAPGFANQ